MARKQGAFIVGAEGREINDVCVVVAVAVISTVSHTSCLLRKNLSHRSLRDRNAQHGRCGRSDPMKSYSVRGTPYPIILPRQ